MKQFKKIAVTASFSAVVFLAACNNSSTDQTSTDSSATSTTTTDSTMNTTPTNIDTLPGAPGTGVSTNVDTASVTTPPIVDSTKPVRRSNVPPKGRGVRVPGTGAQ